MRRSDAGLLLAAAPVAGADTSNVLITIRLTIFGTVPANDGFQVEFGNNGAGLCLPCAGGGHTYDATALFANSSSPVPIDFVRVNVPPFSGGSVSVQPLERFARLTIVPDRDQTVSTWYRCGTNGSPAETFKLAGAPHVHVHSHHQWRASAK